MKKTISASVIMFASAALAITCSVLLLLPVIVSSLNKYIDGKAASMFLACCLCLTAGSAFLITGGILLLVRKKFAYWFCVTGTGFIISDFLMIAMVFKLLNYWRYAYSISMNLCIIFSFILACVGICLTPRHKGYTLAYLGMVISVGGASELVIYCLYALNSAGLAAGFIVLGLLTFILSAVAVVRAIRGKNLSFELMILALMFQIGQYLLMCTLTGVAINAYIPLLGIGSAIPITIGGILINDSVESGFQLVAFGMIFLLAYLLAVLFVLGAVMFIAGLLTVAGVVIYVGETILISKNRNG